MPSEFDFLRIKWPKMAALAADASRLVDISPSSAIASMRTFCEWASDIALDMYKVQVMPGATQMEKLEALQATGRVPTEILQKFHNIRTAGNDAVHRALGDTDTARASLLETKEIGQWLFRESDTHARPRDPSPIRRVPLEGLYPDEEKGRSSKSMLDGSGSHGNHMRPTQFFRQYGPQLVMGGGVLLVIGIIVLIALLVSRCSGGTGQTPGDTTGPQDSGLASASPAPSVSPTVEPSPTPQPSIWFDSLEPSTEFAGLNIGKWDAGTMSGNFQMNNKLYDHGVGMFVPSREINEEQGSKQATWALLSKYSTLVFDLGVEQNFDYGQEFGSFRLRIYLDEDETPVYDSEMQSYDYFAENVTVDVSGCNSLLIKITERKGSGGTLNVVMGNAKLYGDSIAAPIDQATAGPDEQATAGPDQATTQPTDSAGASASPAP